MDPQDLWWRQAEAAHGAQGRASPQAGEQTQAERGAPGEAGERSRSHKLLTQFHWPARRAQESPSAVASCEHAVQPVAVRCNGPNGHKRAKQHQQSSPGPRVPHPLWACALFRVEHRLVHPLSRIQGAAATGQVLCRGNGRRDLWFQYNRRVAARLRGAKDRGAGTGAGTTGCERTCVGAAGSGRVRPVRVPGGVRRLGRAAASAAGADSGYRYVVSSVCDRDRKRRDRWTPNTHEGPRYGTRTAR